MKNMFKTTLMALAFSMAASTVSATTLINLEEAAEVSSLKMKLDKNGSALIYARICDYCELLTLRAGNSTKVDRGGRALSLQEAAGLKNKGATVLFDPATSKVTRILFWN